MNEVECRYCKAKGHYKNQCPKLTGNKDRNRDSRPWTARGRESSYGRRGNKSRGGDSRGGDSRGSRCEYKPRQPIKPPKPSYEELFPAIDAKSDIPTVVNVWGKKSFVDVLEDTEKLN